MDHSRRRSTDKNDMEGGSPEKGGRFFSTLAIVVSICLLLALSTLVTEKALSDQIFQSMSEGRNVLAFSSAVAADCIEREPQQHDSMFDAVVTDTYDIIRRDQKDHEDAKAMLLLSPKHNNGNDTIKFDITTWNRKTAGGLSDADRLFLARLYGNATAVFEYGLGESTYIADHVRVPRYAGIDSDVTWVDQTRQNVAATSPHFRFYYGDVGGTKQWGFPVDGKLAKILYQYQVAPLQAEQGSFDVYMVDGRYRVACLLLSFLHAASYGNMNPIVLLHDCYQKDYSPPNAPKWSNRAGYKIVDEHFTLVDHSHGFLCAYQRPPQLTDEDIYNLWQQYRTEEA